MLNADRTEEAGRVVRGTEALILFGHWIGYYICVWNKNELPEQWKISVIVPIYKKGNKTDQ
jgi:hypothetical protein